MFVLKLCLYRRPPLPWKQWKLPNQQLRRLLLSYPAKNFHQQVLVHPCFNVKPPLIHDLALLKAKAVFKFSCVAFYWLTANILISAKQLEQVNVQGIAFCPFFDKPNADSYAYFSSAASSTGAGETKRFELYSHWSIKHSSHILPFNP